MKIEFKEEQKFTQWWIWLLVILTSIFPIVTACKQLLKSDKIGGYSLFSSELVLFSIPVFLVVIFFVIVKLKTSIDKRGIKMSFFPILKKQLDWNDIKTAKVVNYGFIGGWGIRLTTKYGTVYNIRE